MNKITALLMAGLLQVTGICPMEKAPENKKDSVQQSRVCECPPSKRSCQCPKGYFGLYHMTTSKLVYEKRASHQCDCIPSASCSCGGRR